MRVYVYVCVHKSRVKSGARRTWVFWVFGSRWDSPSSSKLKLLKWIIHSTLTSTSSPMKPQRRDTLPATWQRQPNMFLKSSWGPHCVIGCCRKPNAQRHPSIRSPHSPLAAEEVRTSSPCLLPDLTKKVSAAPGQHSINALLYHCQTLWVASPMASTVFKPLLHIDIEKPLVFGSKEMYCIFSLFSLTAWKTFWMNCMAEHQCFCKYFFKVERNWSIILRGWNNHCIYVTELLRVPHGKKNTYIIWLPSTYNSFSVIAQDSKTTGKLDASFVPCESLIKISVALAINLHCFMTW